MSYVIGGSPNTQKLIGGGYRVTTGSTFTANLRHFFISVNKDVGSATTIYLPFNPIWWVFYQVKDAKGDAGANNITVYSQSGSLIDGQSSVVIDANYGSITAFFDGKTWGIV